MLSPELLEILVCPVCKMSLVMLEEQNSLRCNHCQREYPIRDGIPVLLVDESSRK